MSLVLLQVSETVRAFSQGGSGSVKMCEAAGVPLERYEQAQLRVDEKQNEWNKQVRIVERCQKKAKPLIKAITGLKTRLKNTQAKIARWESGGVPAQHAMAAADSEPDAADSADSDSDGEYAPGDKRKSGNKPRASGSRSKRRKKLLSDSESDVELFMSSADEDSDDDSEEEEVAALPAAKPKGQGPMTLAELQAQAAELETALEEKTTIVKTLRTDERY